MIKPTRNKVMIKVKKKDGGKSKKGIILPETVKNMAYIGEIVSIGKEVENFNIGDTVLFHRYAGEEIEKDIIILKEDEILAKVEVD